MRNYIVYNGKNSIDHHIGIEQCPSYPTGSRAVEKITVPGRSGDLLIDTGAYSNYTQQYQVYIKAKREGVPQMCRAVAGWLLSGRGYHRLEDSYDPSVYRLACFAGPLDVENWMLQYGRATLEFDCRPQRYLKAGEQSITLTNGQPIHNPGQRALPLITLTGSGAGQIVVGDVAVNISDIPGRMVLDCDTQDAYNGTANLNGSITLPAAGFPALEPGDTTIGWSGGITGVEIVPRWWVL